MNAGAYVTGSQLKKLGQYYAKAIHDTYGDDFDVLFGPAYKGIPLAVVTAIAYSELYGKEVRYCSDRKEEKDHGADKGSFLGSKLKDGDRVIMIEDVTTSGKSMEETVPKVNVVVGKAYGSAYVVMNSKSIGADMVFAWPNAEIGMMDAKSAAKIMYEGSDAATINEKAAEYATLQNNVTSAARRGYVDTIIEPEDTRKYVIGAFEMLYTKREDRPDRKHGTV